VNNTKSEYTRMTHVALATTLNVWGVKHTGISCHCNICNAVLCIHVSRGIFPLGSSSQGSWYVLLNICDASFLLLFNKSVRKWVLSRTCPITAV
jgi:hypothetical protein